METRLLKHTLWKKYLFHIWDRIIYIIEDFEQERGYGHLLIPICQFKKFQKYYQIP